MATPGQDLFASILRVSSGAIDPKYFDAGVSLEWDLVNQELRGSFRIPIQPRIDNETGEYVITAQDFVSDHPPSA